jgi:hypothetical protein
MTVTGRMRDLRMFVRGHVYMGCEDENSCTGILLEYENGSQCMLGQVRLHVDRYVTYDKPLFIGIGDGETGRGEMEEGEVTMELPLVSFAQVPGDIRDSV